MLCLFQRLTFREYVDLVDGKNTLLTLVKSQGIKVYNNLTAALQHTTYLLQNSVLNGITPEEQVTGKLR